MSEISGIYDSSVISPVAKVKQNLAIMTHTRYEYYQIDYLEPIPPGPANIVDAVTASGNTSIAAGGTIQKQIVTILQVNHLELLHLRFKVLDAGIEAVIWELSGQQKFKSKNLHCRIDQDADRCDPTFSGTTFFVLGIDRDMNLEVRNSMGYAAPMARVMFWGFRYMLRPIVSEQHSDYNNLSQGDPEAIRRANIGPVTFLPAEGRG